VYEYDLGDRVRRAAVCDEMSGAVDKRESVFVFARLDWDWDWG